MKNNTGINGCPGGQYRGIGFIRSRKSEGRIMDMAEVMTAVAVLHGIELSEIIVDDGGSRDIDREKVGKLYEYMERGCIDVVVLCSVSDITDSLEDARSFLQKAGSLGVSVCQTEYGFFPVCAACGGDGI